MEHLATGRLDLREGVQRLEAVKGEHVVAARADGLLDDLEEDHEPVLRRLRAVQPAPELPHVQDVDADSWRFFIPIRAAPAFRLSMSCSRLTYSDLTPFARAFSCITQRMREVFIVPGVPATRTVLPFGMPPPRARSSPSTYVWRRGTSTSISPGRRSPRYKVMASSLSMEIFTGDTKSAATLNPAGTLL